MNWQTNTTGGCTTTYTSSSYIPSFNGVTCIYTPGFVVGHYANNAACTWIIPKKHKCTSLQFLLVMKDLAHNEQNGRHCAKNDHLDVDDGQRLYCDRQDRSNCPYSNCPSATYATGVKLVSANCVRVKVKIMQWLNLASQNCCLLSIISCICTYVCMYCTGIAR